MSKGWVPISEEEAAKMSQAEIYKRIIDYIAEHDPFHEAAARSVREMIRANRAGTMDFKPSPEFAYLLDEEL